MMRMTRMVAVGVVAAAVGVATGGTPVVSGVTNWVDSAVAVGKGTGTAADPYGDLNFAITNLNRNTRTSDAVILKKGVYRLSSYLPEATKAIRVEKRDMNSNLLVAGETGDPKDVVIDCEGKRAFLSGGALGLTLRGVTVRNGFTDGRAASAVDLMNNRPCAVEDCVFENCLSVAAPTKNHGCYGGALNICRGTVARCVFETCVVSNETGSAFGGGLAGVYGDIAVTDCAFRRCKAYGAYKGCPSGMAGFGGVGGGGVMHYCGKLAVTNCTFESCTAEGPGTHVNGGGILCSGCDIEKCSFADCRAKTSGGAISGGKGFGCTFRNCTSPAEELAAKRRVELKDEPWVEKGVTWFPGRWLYVHGMLEGKAFADTESFYDRLPEWTARTINGGAWHEQHSSAGLCARFTADADGLLFRWRLRNDADGMYHMAPTGVSGFDVYVYRPDLSRWTYAKTLASSREVNDGAFSDCAAGTSVQVNFPLYNGVREFAVGVKGTNVTLKALAPRKSGVTKPVVVYGTSITQGGCASRPGMAFTHIIGRDLDVPMVNLGFSGSGKMDACMVEALAKIDASCYVLDTLWNMNNELITTRYEKFVRDLRTKRPDTPILLPEDSRFDGEINSDKTPIRPIYEKLVAEGMKGLYFVEREKLYPADGDATVDRVHANDWGMKHYAKGFEAALKPILGL